MKHVKKLVAGSLVGVMAMGMTVSAAPANPFADMTDETAWYYGNALAAYEAGYISGMPGASAGELLFAPEVKLTREQFVQILYAKQTDKLVTFINGGNFDDVIDGDNAWYENAVVWAAKEGITSGVDADTFGVGNTMNRAQFVTMLRAYAKYKGFDTTDLADISTYPDAADLDTSSYSWAKDATAWAIKAGIMSGVGVEGVNHLKPGDDVTRAMCATMLMKFDEKYGIDSDGSFKINSTDPKTQYDVWQATLDASGYYPEYADGDNITITIKLKSDKAFSGAIGCNIDDPADDGDKKTWKNIEKSGEAGENTWTVSFDKAYWDPNLQIYSMEGDSVEVLSVTIAETQAEEPEDPQIEYGTVWEGEVISGSWKNAVQVEKSKFANFKFDGTEKLVVTYTSENTSTWGNQFKFAANRGNWEGVVNEGYNTQIAATTATEAVTLTSDYAILKDNDLIIQGNNWIITKIEVLGGASEVWSGEKAIGWGDPVTVDASKFEGVTFDGSARLYITYQSTDPTADFGQFKFIDGSWTMFGTNDAYNVSAVGVDVVEEVVLTSEYASAATSGFLITGNNNTVTKVEIIK